MPDDGEGFDAATSSSRSHSPLRPPISGDALDDEVNRLAGQQPPLSSSRSRSGALREETARILQLRMAERQRVAEVMAAERSAQRLESQYRRQERETAWRARLRTSPFAINLLAQSERIDEDAKVRLHDEARRQRQLESRKDQVKTEIILKALSETSDLEALRQEKRAIVLEERRLKALLDLERAKLRKKEDMLAAQRAEKERRSAKLRAIREQRQLEVEREEIERRALLMEKHELDGDESQFAYPVGRGVMGSLGGRLG
jgi:hypothetical protein